MGLEIPRISPNDIKADLVHFQRQALGSKAEQEKKAAKEAEGSVSAGAETAAKALQDTFAMFSRRVELSVNRDIDRIIIKVIDRETDKVIKEIPPQEIQHLLARIKETLGLLVDESR